MSMSEYLTYTLWRNREKRMPHELERRRAAQERLEQDQEQLDEQALSHEQLLGEHRSESVRELPVSAEATEPTRSSASPESAVASTASTGASAESPVPSAASAVSSKATAKLEHQLVER
jgi:hypothetical protein